MIGDSPPSASAAESKRVPRRYFELAELAALFRSEDRFALLYRVLFRLTHGEPKLLEDELDDDVRRLTLRAQSVRRDEHRMHAFVRFRRTLRGEDEWFVAWYAPEHYILRLAAPFFQRRSSAMRWSILTPDASAHWDGTTMHFGLRRNLQPGSREPAADAQTHPGDVCPAHAGAGTSAACVAAVGTRRRPRR